MWSWLVGHALGLVAILSQVFVSVAGTFALFRYRSDVKHRRWLDAKSLYASVLDDQLKYPNLRAERWTEIKACPEELHRYSVLMNKLLWALEGMLKVDSGSKEWWKSAILIASIHKDYLGSDGFRSEAHLFSEKLRDAIEEGAKLEHSEEAGRNAERQSAELETSK